MSIFSRAFKKHSGSVLLVNIGSASVTAAYMTLKNDLPTIVANVSCDIQILSDLTLTQFEHEMEKALQSALYGIAKQSLPSPDSIAVYLASPWYASQVRVAKMSRPTQFVVSKTVLNDMTARELKAFEEEEIAGKKDTKEAVRAIESKIVQVKLNGYPSADPIGLSVKELELSIFLSIAPERTLARIEEIIGRQYHHPITFSSFLMASFLVTRDFFPHQSESLLIDIGGEVTEISLIRDSALVQSVSFPRGRNFILRRLSAGLKRPVPEALALCTLYREGTIEESMKADCERALKDAKDQWLDSFQKALFSISNELSIPDTVFLSVGIDIAPWFIETIRREEFHQYTLTEKEFKVIVLDAEIFHESLAFGENVARNPFIMIEALVSARRLLPEIKRVPKA